MIGFLSFLLAIVPPAANSSISSHDATYDGSTLYLEGDVLLDHGFGTMKAGKAALARQIEADFPFSSIELEQSVTIDLSTEAKVECEKAILDFSTLQGELTSPTQVHYTDTLGTVPFELFSPHLNLQMVKNTTYSIEKAHATQNVHLIYDTLYHLETASICLSNNLIEGPESCVWTYQNDRVNAENFELDLSQNTLHLHKTSGTLSSLSNGEAHFTADAVHWKHTENNLSLQGFPKVKESSFGEITSDQEINLILQNQTLHHLISKGKTVLTSKKGQRLTTEGSIILNHETCLATIDSPLAYEDDEITLEAEKAQIHYREDFHPSSIELEGHVKIFSQDMQGIGATLTYDPDTKACILKAEEGQKVLFSRKQDQLRMSAPEVHITYDPISKEQQVQGVGHVSFSFSLEEQNFLNEVFHHVASTP